MIAVAYTSLGKNTISRAIKQKTSPLNSSLHWQNKRLGGIKHICRMQIDARPVHVYKCTGASEVEKWTRRPVKYCRKSSRNPSPNPLAREAKSICPGGETKRRKMTKTQRNQTPPSTRADFEWVSRRSMHISENCTNALRLRPAAPEKSKCAQWARSAGDKSHVYIYPLYFPLLCSLLAQDAAFPARGERNIFWRSPFNSFI